MNLPLVALIVLNWNQRELTLECLCSVSLLDYPADCMQVILVDNGSRDGSAEAVRERFPGVTVLVNAENLGFAEGNNVGMRYVLQGEAAYILLLNNDTIVDPLMLQELVATAEADSRNGIVGPKMLYYSQPTTVWCAGNRIDWRSGATQRLQAETPDDAAEGEPQAVDFITACALCCRREVIEQVGLLDPQFYLYYEETDWCVRARRAGWGIRYVPRARLWHRVSASIGTTSPATDYYMARNALLFLSKHRRGLGLVRSLAQSAGRTLLAVAAYTVKPHGGKRLRQRDARLLALRDALLGRWGKMGADVAAVCYPREKGSRSGA